MANRLQRRRQVALQRKRVKLLAKATGKQIAFRVPVTINATSANATEQRRFEMVAYTGQPLSLDGFKLPVVIEIDSIDFSAQSVPALHQHEQSAFAAVGQIDRIAPSTIDGFPGILAGGYFTPTNLPGDVTEVVMKKHDAGQKWQASVGGNPGQLEQVAAGQKIKLNGREYVGPIFVAKRFAFREISFVLVGADSDTSVSAKSKVKIKGAAMSFDEWLMSLGFADPASLDEVQKANLTGIFKEKYPDEEPMTAEGETEEEEPPPLAAKGETEEEEEPPLASKAKLKIQAAARIAAQRKADANEEVRKAAIRKLCDGKAVEVETVERGVKRLVPIQAHAISQGWSANKTELEIYRHGMGAGPNLIVTGHEKRCSTQSLQGAMILRAGGRLDHPAYKTRQGQALLGKVAPWLLLDINAADKNKYMEAAHRYSSMSMVDLCRESCRLGGIDTPSDREDMIRAAFSGGGNLTNIFTTNVNAILLTAYMEDEDTTAGWVSEQDVNDYKTNERPRVQVGDGLKRLPRNSEAEHTSYTDLLESYKISKYARQFEIDDQDIVDDSFSVFADTPKQMGQAAARLRADLVYGAVMLANPTLSATAVAVFSDTNDNLQGSSALSHAKLSSGIAMMMLFRENSVNLNLKPTHLIVPPTLEDLAVELTASRQIIAATGTDVTLIRGTDNSLNRHGLQVVSEARLENGVTNPADDSSQSGSASTWFLASSQAHTIEVGYLKGTGRAPRVRTTVLDKGRWGINWDVELSIGVKALDWKGFVKSTA